MEHAFTHPTSQWLSCIASLAPESCLTGYKALNCALEQFSVTATTLIHPFCVYRAIQCQPWAPNSPDLTPCDYWLHGNMKVTKTVLLQRS